MEACHRIDVKTTLKSISSKARKGCIIGVFKGRNQCSHRIALEMLLNSNTIRWLVVTMRHKSDSN